jgi:hypothetical protein
MVEGSQGSLVGLAPVQPDLNKDTHPIAYLDRYLMGRQFMVTIMVSTIGIAGGPNKDAEVFGMPSIITNIFLGSGLAMALFTCMIGQLNSQVNGCHCMLDYINNDYTHHSLGMSQCTSD